MEVRTERFRLDRKTQSVRGEVDSLEGNDEVDRVLGGGDLRTSETARGRQEMDRRFRHSRVTLF